MLRLIDATSEWVGKIFSYLLIAIMLLTSMEVVLRYVFSRPTSWSGDISLQLSGAVGLLAGTYTLLHHGHVGVDSLYKRLPGKGKILADGVSWACFFLFTGVLLWKGGQSAWTSVINRERQFSVLAPPLYPIKILLVAAIVLLLLQGTAEFTRFLISLRRGETN